MTIYDYLWTEGHRQQFQPSGCIYLCGYFNNLQGEPQGNGVVLIVE